MTPTDDSGNEEIKKKRRVFSKKPAGLWIACRIDIREYTAGWRLFFWLAKP
jgi:hypothetical protein